MSQEPNTINVARPSPLPDIASSTSYSTPPGTSSGSVATSQPISQPRRTSFSNQPHPRTSTDHRARAPSNPYIDSSAPSVGNAPPKSRFPSSQIPHISHISQPTSPRLHSNGRPSTASGSVAYPFSAHVLGTAKVHYQILLINPNSTPSMTQACLSSVQQKLPLHVSVTGYTAPAPAPSAIESNTDAILSTEACIRDLAKYSAANHETVKNFDAMLVACFSKHPLIDALRELYDVPVIGIMEASIYTARMLGARFGIVATSQRSKLMQEDAIRAYGMEHFYVGSEVTGYGVLDLEKRPRSEVLERVGQCAKRLAIEKGADTVLLGCAGMTDMVRACKDAVRNPDGRRMINVIDGVEAGMQLLLSLVGMGVPTSKKGVYLSARVAMKARGQEWL